MDFHFGIVLLIFFFPINRLKINISKYYNDVHDDKYIFVLKAEFGISPVDADVDEEVQHL
jgi:hypothetical protein